MININEPVSLNELSKDLGIAKSRLSFYVSNGLITPVTTVGRMQIFDREEVEDVIRDIDEKRAHGISLAEIKRKMDREK